MYAIIASGGKQYRVTEGQKVRVEKLTGDADDEITLGEVLAFNDGQQTVIGAPFVQGAAVTGKIVAHGKARKVTIFKYKRRKDTKKKKGHRQPYTEVMIQTIRMEA
jgi:large subunit ribosomal protein L21